MKSEHKIRIALVVVGLAALGVTATAGANVGRSPRVGDDAPSTTMMTAPDDSLTSTTLPTVGIDISGPCDEAEHANDPRCAPVATQTPADAAPSTTMVTAPDDSPSSTTSPTVGVDLSGPCDEVEHANDPRCTGAEATRDSDDRRSDDSGDSFDDPDGRSGRGSDDSGDSFDDSDGRSGRGSDDSGDSFDDSDGRSGRNDSDDD